ncbi:hydrogen peroxide-dependent heme synthase [Tenuibacillus multivorans]|uniref:Coproheme decarboxylase n=1 Tax=Tenuibacillus multivorans TaxID=237069 RepID=A0A1G9WXT2_9BACI|nr:hydrogen peroxide-dependent heme synthase [Tenuibacillus multivorans]GEL77308.1 putative heme-dependent peroxidase [Tenuibacillus multivorans]SDM89310.1 chlorite dismutase [Tenuibacillus multivorans]
MPEAVETLDGWYCLHDFRQVDWTAWKLASEEERKQALKELDELLSGWEEVESNKNGSVGFYQIIGQKADLLFMNLRPTMEELTELETAFNKTKMAEFLIPAYSFVSVVELSTYMAKGKDPDTDPEIQARLKPILPKWDHICFYPMDRKRESDNNWFMEEKDERGRLMYEHGMTGRKYAGKVRQIITGSIGFDDWEWGVTLYAHDMLQFKKLIYEMRFDEVSARFAEFGEFFVGHRKSKDDVEKIMDV